MSKFEKIYKCPRERCKYFSTDFNECNYNQFNNVFNDGVCVLDERLENLCELK